MWQDRRPSGDRPQGGGHPSGDRPDRRPAGDRPQGGRPSGDGPAWQDRRPSGPRGDQDDSAPRRPAGPELPEWVDPRDLDQSVRSALHGLDSRNADTVARHLVAAGGLLEDEPELALEHARAARDRASRIAAVREAVGVAAYAAGDFAEAARELRAYARMSGDESYRAVLADCERGLGRPEIAIRLVNEALEGNPEDEELVELRLVEAGARHDLGELAAAALVLEAALGGRPTPAGLGQPDLGQLRLATAYGELLAARGEQELAMEWFAAIAAADPDDLTGVAEYFGGDDDDLDDDLADDELADDADADAAGVGTAAAGATGQVPEPAVVESDEEFDDVLDEELGDVNADDIEAEVAELLGETPPPVERDHARLFQEAPDPSTEQQPPTN